MIERRKDEKRYVLELEPGITMVTSTEEEAGEYKILPTPIALAATCYLTYEPGITTSAALEVANQSAAYWRTGLDYMIRFIWLPKFKVKKRLKLKKSLAIPAGEWLYDLYHLCIVMHRFQGETGLQQQFKDPSIWFFRIFLELGTTYFCLPRRLYPEITEECQSLCSKKGPKNRHTALANALITKVERRSPPTTKEHTIFSNFLTALIERAEANPRFRKREFKSFIEKWRAVGDVMNGSEFCAAWEDTAGNLVISTGKGKGSNTISKNLIDESLFQRSFQLLSTVEKLEVVSRLTLSSTDA